jgi:hypothetical protein
MTTLLVSYGVYLMWEPTGKKPPTYSFRFPNNVHNRNYIYNIPNFIIFFLNETNLNKSLRIWNYVDSVVKKKDDWSKSTFEWSRYRWISTLFYTQCSFSVYFSTMIVHNTVVTYKQLLLISDLLKRDSEGDLHIQHEGSTPQHVGVKARVSPLQRTAVVRMTFTCQLWPLGRAISWTGCHLVWLGIRNGILVSLSRSLNKWAVRYHQRLEVMWYFALK